MFHVCVSVKDGLYESKSQVYPQNDLSLTCKTTNNSIIWIKDRNKLEASNKYIIDQTNKTTLIVKNITPTDSGKLQKLFLLPCSYKHRIKVNSYK